MGLISRQAIVIGVTLLSVVVFVSSLHYFPNEISYGNYEILSSQYLNAVDVFLRNDLNVIGLNAYLDGNELGQDVYSNFPIFHMYFGYLLVEYGLIENSFRSFQIITAGFSFAAMIFLLLSAFRLTGNKSTPFILLTLLLSNNFIFDLYNDLWWGPYFLFFISVQIFAIVYSRPLLLYFAAFTQFYFNYDASVYVASFLLLYLIYNEHYHIEAGRIKWVKSAIVKNHRPLLAYGLVCTTSFLITSQIKSSFGASTPGGETIIQNMFIIQLEDVFRFIYYYALSPYVIAPLLFLLFGAKKADLQFNWIIILIVWALVWLFLFPAHGTHHSYHYSKILIIGMYFLICYLVARKNKYLIFIPFILMINLLTGYYLFKPKEIDYSGYVIANEYLNKSAVAATNFKSYPMTYFVENKIDNITPPNQHLICNYDSIIVVLDYSIVSVGASQINSAYSRLIHTFTGQERSLKAYVAREQNFIEARDEFLYEVGKCGFYNLYTDKFLAYSIYSKGRL